MNTVKYEADVEEDTAPLERQDYLTARYQDILRMLKSRNYAADSAVYRHYYEEYVKSFVRRDMLLSRLAEKYRPDRPFGCVRMDFPRKRLIFMLCGGCEDDCKA